jgi:hypothetical protein
MARPGYAEGIALRFIPLAVGAPMGTPLGLSACGGFVTVPLFRDWAIDLSHQRAAGRQL